MSISFATIPMNELTTITGGFRHVPGTPNKPPIDMGHIPGTPNKPPIDMGHIPGTPNKPPIIMGKIPPSDTPVLWNPVCGG
jgi:hypothetical protein